MAMLLAAIGWGLFHYWNSTHTGYQPNPPRILGVVSSSLPDVNRAAHPDQPLAEATVAADGSAQFRTVSDALDTIAPHGTIRILDQAIYQENITINDPVRLEGITIDGSSGATVTSMIPTRPIFEVNGVDHVHLLRLKILISESEHAVMITGGAEGTRLDSLRITQPNSKATAAVQIFGANSDEQSADLVITDCVIESFLTGQSLWIHAEPVPVCNLVLTRNRFRSLGKSTLVVVQGCLKHAVIEKNKFEGGHIGLNLNAGPTQEFAVDIVSNTFYRCDSWIGLMSTKPELITVTLTNNLILACPSVDINAQQLPEVLHKWTLGGNCWELDPATVPPDALFNKLADFYQQIEVKSRDPNEAGFLEPVNPRPSFVPKR